MREKPFSEIKSAQTTTCEWLVMISWGTEGNHLVLFTCRGEREVRGVKQSGKDEAMVSDATSDATNFIATEP